MHAGRKIPVFSGLTKEDPMNELRAESLRNVAVVSSAGAGKTSLVEAILFTTGAIPILGTVAQGNTASDFEPEEIHRRTSVSTSLLRCSWQQTTINLVDPPGALNLLGEPLMALQAVDAVINVLGASGIRSELAKLWSRLKELRLPRMIFANEFDKDGILLENISTLCHRELDVTVLPLALPVKNGGQLEGVTDLLAQVQVRSQVESAKVQQSPIPDSLLQEVGEARKRLHEAVAEVDDRLLEQYCASGELTQEDMLIGLRLGVLTGQLIPLFCGSALKNIGIVPLLNAVVSLLPSPAERAARAPLVAVNPDTGESVIRQAGEQDPFSAIVFKTLIDPFIGRLSYIRVLSGTLQADSVVFNASRGMKEKGGHLYTLVGKKHTAVPSARAGEIVALGKLKDTQTGDTLCEETAPIRYACVTLPKPVMSFAIEPKAKADVDKVSLGLHKLIEEDPTLEFHRNADTKEMVLSGLGQLHIDIALEKLHRKYGADVVLHMPKIPYRETIRGTAQAQGKYKKQTGGHGQYGDCWLELSPLPRGAGFTFGNKIVGGAIPRNFIPAVEKGVIEAMQHGTLAGCPVVDLSITVYDGSYHVVDSSEMAFKIAASMGFKKAMEAAHPVLLEPLMTLEVEAPADHIGAVIGDLNARRGRILHVEAKDHTEVITALVPLAEVLAYATTLNSLTGGRGSYVMEYTRYEEVPRDLAGRIIEEQKAEKHTVAAQ
jgi:elongation factor G